MTFTPQEILLAEKLNTELLAKASSAHTHTAAQISDSTVAGRTLLLATTAAAQKTALSLTKTDVGLPNVDNTSDANKPVSTAQAAAIALKANATHQHNAADINAGDLAAARYSATLSAALDSLLGAVAGDIAYRGPSGWARLPKGTTGQFLQMGASAPAWVTVTGFTPSTDVIPVNTVLPVLSGNYQTGQTLSTTDGTWTGSPAPTFAYQWYSGPIPDSVPPLADGDTPPVFDPSPLTAISGATSSTYTIADAMLGLVLYAQITATNAAGSTVAYTLQSGVIAAPPSLIPVATFAPQITGTTQVGQTLSTTSGTWTNSPTSYTYQWRRNGAPISGATASTYVLVTADIGVAITVAVIATNASGTGVASVSSATQTVLGDALTVPVLVSPPVIAAVSLVEGSTVTSFDAGWLEVLTAPQNTVVPTITGNATQGSTLTGTTGTWLANPTATYAYEWRRSGTPISGATASTYVLTGSDVGATITLRVVATNSSGTGAAVSVSTAVVAATASAPVNTALPVISYPAPGIAADFFGIHALVTDFAPWPVIDFGPARLWDVQGYSDDISNYKGIRWSDIHMAAGTFHWDVFDDTVTRFYTTHGVTDLMYTFGGTPAWTQASPDGTKKPDNLADWDAFVTAIVTRAAGRIKRWGLWNEPNGSLFWTGTAAELAAMGSRAYDIIKSIDPTATVVSPETQGNGAPFMVAYMAESGGTKFDVLGIHLYTGVNEIVTGGYFTAHETALANVNKSVPIWDTEFGYYDSFQDAVGAVPYLTKKYVFNATNDIARGYWYAYDHQGIYGPMVTSGTLNATGVAHGVVRGWLLGATVTQTLTKVGTVYTAKFTRGADKAIVAWDEAGSSSYAFSSEYTKSTTPAGTISTVATSMTIGQTPVLIHTPGYAAAVSTTPVEGQTLSVASGTPVVIDPANLASTAVLTFNEDWDTLDLYNGTAGRWATGFHWYPPQGGSLNDEQQWYIQNTYAPTSAVTPWTVSNGVLSITANPTPTSLLSTVNNFAYTSGMLTSYRSFSQQYGYFEAKLQLPKGQGMWPAFWMLPADGGWPPEIDVMEFLGRDPTHYYATTHWSSTNQQVGTYVATPDLSLDYHRYGVRWDSAKVTYFFDGLQVAQHDNQSDMNKPFYMLLNLAIGGSWGGNVDGTTTFPATLKCDWVRAYTATSSTPGTWTGTPTSYAFQWKRGGAAISGATSNSYVLQAADVGAVITVTVTATNAAGSASATSAGTSAVTGSGSTVNSNLLAHPTQMASSSGFWSGGGDAPLATAASSTDIAAPDGSSTVFKITAGHSGLGYNTWGDTAVTAAATTKTLSAYAAAGASSFISFDLYDTTDHFITFSLSGAGSVTQTSGLTSSITRVGAGPWYLISATWTPSTTTQYPVLAMAGSGTQPTDITGVTVYVTRPKYEDGASVTGQPTSF